MNGSKGSGELTCREVVELITDYLEGAMTAAKRARFEDHLSFCEGCRNYLGQLRLTIHATGRLTEDSIPPDVRRALLEAFRGWKRR